MGPILSQMDVEAGTSVKGGDGDLGDGWEFGMSIQFSYAFQLGGKTG